MKVYDRGSWRMLQILEIVDAPDDLKIGGTFTWIVGTTMSAPRGSSCETALEMKIERIAPDRDPVYADGIVVVCSPVL